MASLKTKGKQEAVSPSIQCLQAFSKEFPVSPSSLGRISPLPKFPWPYFFYPQILMAVFLLSPSFPDADLMAVFPFSPIPKIQISWPYFPSPHALMAVFPLYPCSPDTDLMAAFPLSQTQISWPYFPSPQVPQTQISWPYFPSPLVPQTLISWLRDSDHRAFHQSIQLAYNAVVRSQAHETVTTEQTGLGAQCGTFCYSMNEIC